MTRDYVRSSRPAKRKPAGRNAPGRRSNTSNNAPFPMVRAVLALALVIGFGIFLYHISGSSGETETVTTAQTASQAPIPIEQQRPAKEQFDYMQILQNKEVPVELPDGQVISDPSKDPQILQQQQKMQEMLRAQQERAKLLAQQQNGQLPADSMTLTQTVNPGANQTINQTAPGTRNQATATATTTARPAETPVQTADPRKPKSFADVLASESGKTGKTAAAPVTKTAAQERDEALAMFGKPRPYAADATASTGSGATEKTTSKRYMMQCGAFRTADQASSLQSRIAVQGQNAQVRTGSSTSGTWHRVILGPYSSRAAAEQSLSRLKAGGTVQNCTIYAQ